MHRVISRKLGTDLGLLGGGAVLTLLIVRAHRREKSAWRAGYWNGYEDGREDSKPAATIDA